MTTRLERRVKSWGDQSVFSLDTLSYHWSAAKSRPPLSKEISLAVQCWWSFLVSSQTFPSLQSTTSGDSSHRFSAAEIIEIIGKLRFCKLTCLNMESTNCEVSSHCAFSLTPLSKLVLARIPMYPKVNIIYSYFVCVLIVFWNCPNNNARKKTFFFTRGVPLEHVFKISRAGPVWRVGSPTQS